MRKSKESNYSLWQFHRSALHVVKRAINKRRAAQTIDSRVHVLLVDGNWAEWSVWSACQVTCGGAIQTRTRQCSNPAPASGGLNCSGSDMENQQCALNTCPSR